MDDVANRRQFGHWEGDLMLFKQKLGQSNVTSLVERVSRFTVILKNPNKRTKPVMHCLTGDCSALRREGVRSSKRSKTCLTTHADQSPLTVVQSSWTGRICKPRSARKHGSAIRPRPSRDHAAHNPVGQCVAKRHRREHQSPRQTLAAAQT